MTATANQYALSARYWAMCYADNGLDFERDRWCTAFYLVGALTRDLCYANDPFFIFPENLITACRRCNYSRQDGPVPAHAVERVRAATRTAVTPEHLSRARALLNMIAVADTMAQLLERTRK